MNHFTSTCKCWTTNCDNTPPANTHYLNLLNHSWPLDCQVVSLISGQGYFTFLYGHTKHNIHNREGGGKENKQTRTWVSSKSKKEEVCDTFQASSELSRTCIRAKLPQSHQECWIILSRWPTWHLSPHVLFTNPSARPGYDTRSIFKRSLTGLNSEFSFS